MDERNSPARDAVDRQAAMSADTPGGKAVWQRPAVRDFDLRQVTLAAGSNPGGGGQPPPPPTL